MEHANNLIKKANSVFSIFYGGQTELLTQAAAEFSKVSKQAILKKEYTVASEAAVKGGQCYLKVKDGFEANSLFQLAFGVFVENEEFEKATTLLHEYLEPSHTDSGNYEKTGKLYLKLANKLQQTEGDAETIIQYYSKAAEMFEASDSNKQSKVSAWNSIANIYIQQKSFKDASEYFEKSGDAYNSDLTTFSSIEPFMDSILCLIAYDPVAAEQKYERINNCCPKFESSHQGKFCKLIMEAVKDDNILSFTNIVSNYDSLHKLAAYKITTLLEIKKQKQSNAGDSLM